MARNPANTRHSPNVVVVLGRRRRRWANITAPLGRHLEFTGNDSPTWKTLSHNPYSIAIIRHKCQSLNKCCGIVQPASQTIAQHENNIDAKSQQQRNSVSSQKTRDVDPTNVVYMLDHTLQRWPIIKTKLDQRLIFLSNLKTGESSSKRHVH